MNEDPVDRAFILGDFIITDPFRNIYRKRRDDTSDFFYTYTDYFQYLQYLNIIWNRIKEEYKTVGIFHRKSLELTSKYNELSEEERFELNSVDIHEFNMLTVIECDIEAFVLFVRRFLDKVAKLIEQLIVLRPGREVGSSFSDHRKYFIDNETHSPIYSKLLREDTNWYEQDLLIWRDKIFVHGKTLNTGSSVSPTRGIELRKAIGVYRISEKDKATFLRIKRKYEERHTGLKITENPFMMIDEFRE
jgi:hypothetical protein